MTDFAPSEVGRSPVRERTAELAALEGLVAELRPGTGRVAVVQGPPGIGKTTLTIALHQAARGRGLRLLTARGTELGMDVSFRAARQLFADSGELPALLSQADDARDVDGAGPAPAKGESPQPAISQCCNSFSI